MDAKVSWDVPHAATGPHIEDRAKPNICGRLEEYMYARLVVCTHDMCMYMHRDMHMHM